MQTSDLKVVKMNLFNRCDRILASQSRLPSPPQKSRTSSKFSNAFLIHFLSPELVEYYALMLSL